MKNLVKYWQTLVILILAISLISITIFVINKEKESLSQIKPETIYVGYDKKEPLENFSKKGAVKASKDLLVMIGKDIDGKSRTIKERYEVLSNETSDLKDIFTQETIDSLYFSEEFGEELINRKISARALLEFYEIIEKTKDPDSEILEETLTEYIYLDNKFMTAHIPLETFGASIRGVAFEMQYIDGEWKLNPYTAAMSFNLIGGILNNVENSK